ncbi:MAG: OmpA/MotB domain protein [Gemmatimonadetes bacterium]|jgi:outer membrane protein OmpA-like peptidoglycan-associated protein|nr:OmpA/MotB domain protein [Gemmatimonadota bacterium]
MIRSPRLIFAVSLLLASGACASLSKKENGAIIGASAGAVAGRVIGGTAKGAIIGAAVGGAAGAVIGHQMDQQAKEIQNQVPGAIVERVGEGVQVTFASGLLFATESDVLNGNARQNLTALANNLQAHPNTDLLIVGHTDANGTDQYNMSLSERRAAAVVNFLASQGVARERLRPAGRGESEPVASNDTEEGRAKNRRVEVAIYANAAARAEAQRISGQ